MKNEYQAMKQKHQEEVDKFPMFFAFSEKQFAEGMTEFGLEVSDTDKIVSISGIGGFIRETDVEAFREMFLRHEEERKEAIDNDSTGEGFVYEMFSYELANHEYGYTHDLEPALNALGFSLEEVNANKKFLRAFKKACRVQRQR